MATTLKIVTVSVSHSKVDYSNPKDPTNTPAESAVDLSNSILAAIADTNLGPDLSGGFDVIFVEKVSGGSTRSIYNVWVQG